MSFWNWIQGGRSVPSTETRGCRFALRVGRWLAASGPGVHVAPGARISPEARICARGSEIHIGERSIVAMGTLVQGNVRIGSDSSLQAYCCIVGYKNDAAGDGSIIIGNGVRIAPHVVMVAANHVFDNPDIPIHKQGLRRKPIVIEDDCWLGARVNVTAGVTIGRGSVIGGGAVVTRDIPPYSIAVGVPARVIGSRKKDGGAAMDAKTG